MAIEFELQNALVALLQQQQQPQSPFGPLGPTSPFPVQQPMNIAGLFGPIEPPAASIPMSATAATPRFAPLPPVEEEVQNVLNILRSQGVNFDIPAPSPAPGVLQKIALALQGFGAGFQGQGPQFLAGLREQREGPRRRATERREAAIGDITTGIVSGRRQREQAREQAEFGAERALGLEGFRQEAAQTRETQRRADARTRLVGDRAIKLGESGVPIQFAQPIAEALSGLRVWTPELVSAFNTIGAKAKADLARTEALTAQTIAEAQLLPLRARQLRAEIGRIGVLNKLDLERLDPASNKKVNEVFDFSIQQSLDPLLKTGREPTRESILKATNTGRRIAIERLGGDLASYDRFLQRIDSDPAFARYVNTQRQAGFNDLQIINANR